MINEESRTRRISIHCCQREISRDLYLISRIILCFICRPIEERLPVRRGNSRRRLDVRAGVFCIFPAVNWSCSAAFTDVIRNLKFFRIEVVRIERDVAVKVCIEIVKGEVFTVFCCPSNPRIALRDLDGGVSGSLLNRISLCVLDGRHIIFIDHSAVINLDLNGSTCSLDIGMNGSRTARCRPLRVDHDIVCRHRTVEIERNRAFLILEPPLEGVCFRKTGRTGRHVRFIVTQ